VRFETLFKKWRELGEINQTIKPKWPESGEIKPKRLLELILVVFVIGILAVIVFPTSNCGYYPRSKVAEAMQLLGGLKVSAVEYYHDKEKWPTVASITNVTKGKYVSIIKETPKYGFYAVMKDTDISGPDYSKVLTLFYSTPGGVWKCDAAGTVNSGKPTSIDAKHLPAACR